ncbi:MAG: methionine--tRNA ligase [bacterium]|jgi:methionyl-tRNA synthetase
MDKFYLTTPIYYVNAKPHLGTTYTTVIADIVARFMRMSGRDTLMVTGSDEHSQGIADLAAAEGIDPRAFCDRIIPSFHEAWRLVEIENYRFERTSDPKHVNVVQKFFGRIYEKGDIYKGEYAGWYHTTDNRFLNDDEVPEHPENEPRLKYLTEESYYFRLSKYQDILLRFFEENPEFVVPDFRRTEMLNRIKDGLKDLCISRTSTSWGVPLPWDSGHVFYVWVDALLTYLTGSGFDIDGYLARGGLDLPPEELWTLGKGDIPGQGEANFWPCDLNIMAKDIPWFHAVIFPAMLLSFGLPPVKKMVVHGYWNFGGDKMSKSLGNVVSPQEACDLVGADGLRYFFAREVPLGLDGNFSLDLLVDRYNFDLGNDLGNLVHRMVSLAHQLFGGKVPDDGGGPDASGASLLSERDRVVAEAEAAYRELRLSDALKSIWELIRNTNRYIDEKEPWRLKKHPERRGEIAAAFAVLFNVMKTALFLVSPVIPGAAQKLWEAIGLSGKLSEFSWDEVRMPYPLGSSLPESTPVFPRVEPPRNEGGNSKADTALPENSARKKEEKKMDTPAEGIAVLAYEDFAKVQLITALVKSCAKVEGADKLLKVELDDGTPEGRTIAAGIAEWYKPEDLAGKTIVIVANLQPRKLRGIVSRGMLLAAQDGSGNLSVLTVDRPMAPGAKIS